MKDEYSVLTARRFFAMCNWKHITHHLLICIILQPYLHYIEYLLKKDGELETTRLSTRWMTRINWNIAFPPNPSIIEFKCFGRLGLFSTVLSSKWILFNYSWCCIVSTEHYNFGRHIGVAIVHISKWIVGRGEWKWTQHTLTLIRVDAVA